MHGNPVHLPVLSTSRTDPPTVLIIRALEACNAGCFMCQFAHSKDSYRFTHGDAAELAQTLSSTGISHIRLTGGETLLLEDLDKIGLAFKQRLDARLSLITNGYYLPEKSNCIAAGGFDQVIISIDGAGPESHDKFRKTPGLFDRCLQGVRVLRSVHPGIVIRVNTVVGRHNIEQLCSIYDVLQEWEIDQWSLIPLKQSGGAWGGYRESDLRRTFERFRAHATRDQNRLRILGHGLDWIGRDGEEFRRFWDGLQPMTPRGACRVVDAVRYYTPKDGLVYPCNCVPHRDGGVTLGEQWSADAPTAKGLEACRDWLRENGPKRCRGCEPINAALGEGDIDLVADPFGF